VRWPAGAPSPSPSAAERSARHALPGPVFRVADATEQLEASLHALVWASCLIPEAAAHESPEPRAWSAATNLAHLLLYEERVSVPVIEALLRGEDGTAVAPNAVEGWLARESEALGASQLSVLAPRWERARARLIAAVRRFGDAEFNEPRCAVTTPMLRDIGLHPAGLVAMKAYQHTWEHGNVILRTARVACSRTARLASGRPAPLIR